MNIIFTGHHLTVTPALKEMTTQKLEKIRCFTDETQPVHVVFGYENLEQFIEAKIIISGQEFYAKANNKDMYKAIDSMVTKLKSQLQKHKEKNSSHRE